MRIQYTWRERRAHLWKIKELKREVYQLKMLMAQADDALHDRDCIIIDLETRLNKPQKADPVITYV